MSQVTVPISTPDTCEKPYGLRDVVKECENVKCQIEGEDIPLWLNGTIYKQAGGAFGEKSTQLDGLAHLAAFKITEGRIEFTNKYIKSKDYANFVRKGERTWNGTSQGTKNSSFLQNFKNMVSSRFSWFRSSENKYDDFNPNVTTWLFENGDKVAAQTEVGGKVCLVDPNTLDTISECNTLKPINKGQLISTPAHYFREGSAGGFHVALELSYTYKTLIPTFSFHYNIYKGDVAPFKPIYSEVVDSFKYTERHTANGRYSNKPAYMHCIAVSENYVVILESSMRYDYVKLLKGDFTEGFFSVVPIVDTPIEFILLRRVVKDGKETLVRETKLTSSAHGMIWHVSNCFEVGDEIVIEAGSSKELYKEPNCLQRFVLNTNTKSVQTKTLLDDAEFPIVNPEHLMKRTEFQYVLEHPLDSKASLVKLHCDRSDTMSDEVEKCFQLFDEEDVIPSEPCFIANPEAKSEDDGIILTMVTDRKREKSYLALIDGITGDIRATAESPVAVNLGLHSIYIPNENLETYISKL